MEIDTGARIPTVIPGALQRFIAAAQTRDLTDPGSAKQHFMLHRIRDDVHESRKGCVTGEAKGARP